MRLNSFDEWTRLREVILGSADGYAEYVNDISFTTFSSDNVTGALGYYPTITGTRGEETSAPEDRVHLHRRYVEELIEDVADMKLLLESFGVKVHRPMGFRRSLADVSTPAWSAPVTPPLNVRDNHLILGDEVIETSSTRRARYFETMFLEPIFMEYFRNGSRWTAMPRPLLTDSSYDAIKENADASFGLSEHVQSSPYDVGLEMMMDAANCLRIGRDIVVNVANINHELACDWLERHYAGRFRFHRVKGITRSHIDSVVLALRPGILMVRSNDVIDYLPDALRGWKIIVPPEPTVSDFPQYPNGYPIPPSPYIDMNVLSIDENTVLVNQECRKLIRLLETNGFTVAPFRHRHRRLFGGGMHCFTLDTVRDGGFADYLS